MEISVRDYARECAEQGLRGDYSRCRSDFTVAQEYDYSDEQQAVWRGLFDYFAFEQHGPALAHLAPEHRGLMGLSSAQQAEAIKGILGEAFKR